jgi:hypothetical protein
MHDGRKACAPDLEDGVHVVGHDHFRESSNSVVLFQPGKAVKHGLGALGPLQEGLPFRCCRS